MLNNTRPESFRFRVGTERIKTGPGAYFKTSRPDSIIYSPDITTPKWVDLSMRM